MEAPPTREPTSPATAVPADALAAIGAAYERGRYLDAWTLARPLGPLATWCGADALVLAGRLAQRLGDGRLGSRLHLRALREDPGSPSAWAWALRALGGRLGAFAALDLARRRPPPAETAETASWRAEVAIGVRDLDEAERQIDRARALAPDDPWPLVLRASALKEADLYEDALAQAERAFEAHPWYRPAVDARVDLLVLLGRDEEALALLHDAMGRFQAASVATELAGLQLEHGQHDAVEATLDRLEALTPLRDRHYQAWIDARRSDAAHHRGDRARAVEYARRAGEGGIAFYARLAERLGRDAPAERVLLQVPWVRQHRLTCAPATMTALVRHFGVDARHLEIAEAICYDGTPDHAQRAWAARQGLVAREFTVTWDAATALLDRGVPFALTTVDPGNAHMQAVVGYDRARHTLLLRDPYYRYRGEIVGDAGLADYASSGPKGLVLLPPAEAHRLDGLELPDAALHDRYQHVQAALVVHDRAAAAAATAELRAAAPGHRLSVLADRSMASYDADEPARLRATEALLARWPDDVNLRLAKQASLADLGRRDERIAWLRAECARAGHPLLRLALAEVLRADARAWPEALRTARLVARGPNAAAHHTLANVLWDAGDRGAALLAYRAAACIERTDERFAESYFLAARLAGRADEAIAFLRDRFERQGRKAPWPAMTLYDALDVLDRRREALEVLDRAVAWRPADGPLLLFAARARAAGAEPDAAEALLARAGAAARPADLARTRAQLAETRGDLAAAAAAWRELADLEPFNLDAVRAAARLLEATRGVPEAVAFLRARVDRHPHHHGLCRLLAEWLGTGPPAEREAAIRRILDANPSDAWAWRELALALSTSRRTDEALAAVARAGEIDPRSPSHHGVRAFVLEEAGRSDEAKAALREALRASVDEEWALRELLRISADAAEREAQLAFVHGEIVRQVLSGDALLAYQRAAAGVLDPERLVAELRAAWEARPDLWHAWVALARQLEQAGRTAEAVALLGRAAERFELLPRIWIELADAHRAAGDRAAQRAALERAVALAPGWPEAAVKLAEVLHVDRDFARERPMLALAARRAPGHALLRGWLADASWEAGEREAAVAELERALALDPTYGWAWERLSHFARELGRPDAALAAAERIAAEHAHDPNAWVLAARARRGVDGKLEALERALAIAPRLAAAHELRVDVLADAGRLDEALAAARAPILAGHVPRSLRLKAARLLAQRGDAGGARAALEELVAAEPDHAEAWAQLAQWHEEAGRHEDAVGAARRLVRLAPSDAVPHGFLGRALLGAGDRSAGKAELRRAIALDPGYGWAVLRLADAELEDRNPDGAAEVLPVVERHAPEEAPLLRLRIAVAREDRKLALAALHDLAKADDRERLDAAARAFVVAGWEAELDDDLEALLFERWASRAAGALFVARTGSKEWPRARRRAFRAALAEAEPTPAARGAAEARLGQLAGPRAWLRLLLFVRRHRAVLEADVDLWGSVGYALSSAHRHARAVAWLGGWKARAGVKPWMLLNLAVSLRELGRIGEASEASRAAVALAPDHTTPMHEVMLAVDAALAGDGRAAGRLGGEHRALGPHYRCLLAFLDALAASAAPGDRGAAFRAAVAHVRAAEAAKRDWRSDVSLRRLRRAVIRRIARARAGGGALAPAFSLLARVALRFPPTPWETSKPPR